jgi:hypothetical protein
MIDNTIISCTICNKKYASKYNLLTHNKKFHVELVLKEIITDKRKFNCRTCDKIYSTKQSRWLHEKTCKKQKEYTVIIKLEEKIIELENKMKNSSNNKIIKKITNNITNNTNNCIINNLIINNYSKDNYQYITEKFKDRLFRNLCDRDDYIKPIPSLIENIKFNPNHKENHNVKIKSDRSKIGLIYDEHKWKAMNKNELLEDLMNYGFKIFDKYFNERKDNLSEDIIDNYIEFRDVYIDDLKKEIKDKIENIAYIFTKNNNDENVLD